jgi:hypothetical protein
MYTRANGHVHFSERFVLGLLRALLARRDRRLVAPPRQRYLLLLSVIGERHEATTE